MGENNRKSGAGWIIIIVFIVLGVIAYALIYDFLKGEDEIVPTEPFETVETENGAAPATSETKDYVIDEEKRIDEQGIAEVNIEAISSEVNVIPVDDDAFSAHFYGDISTGAEPPKMMVTTTGDRLNIVIEHPKDIFSGFQRLETTLDVFVPESYKDDIRIKTVSGSVDIGELEAAKFVVESTSGNIRASSVICETSRISTVSGFIKIGTLSADRSNLSSTSGNIEVDGLKGELTGKSVSGSFDVTYQALKDDVEIESTSGDVVLVLPEDAEFQVELQTTSGKFFVDFPIRMTGNGSDRYFKGVVGNAEHKVNIQTISGDIRIEQD